MPVPAWLVPAIQTAGSFISGLINNRNARKEAQAMRDYNTPANQMKRFTEAGLSPYLIYQNASAGNMTQPIPEQRIPDIGESIGNYMAYANFEQDMATKRLNNAILATQAKRLQQQYRNDIVKGTTQELQMLSDYPDFNWNDFYANDEQINKNVPLNSFRKKLNELKLALAQASVNRIQTSIEGMNSKNAIERVKAKYATDYGMVGGDWTQGIGLVKSIPSMFKGARKIPQQEKALLDSYRKFKGDQYKRNANRFLFEQLKP